MFRGFFIGSGVAMALSLLLVSAVSLLAPMPQPPRLAGEDAPRTTDAPEAPVMQTARDSVPAQPEPLPVREAPTPVALAADADATDGAEDATARRETTAISAVAVPAGSEFNRPPVDRDPVAPRVDDQPQIAAPVPAPRGPQAPTAAPTPNTTTAAQPAVTFSVAGVSAPEEGDAPAMPVSVAEGAPQTFRLPGVVDSASPEEVAVSTDVGVEAGDAAQDVVPDAIALVPDADRPVEADVAEATAPADESDVVDVAGTEEADAPAPEAVVSDQPPLVFAEAIQPLDRRAFIDPTDTAGPITLVEDPIQAPRRTQDAPEPEPVPERGPVIIKRIVLDSERAATEAAEAAAEAESKAKLNVNAVAFDNPDQLPLFGIILIDDGNGDVERENLLSFDLPVTFAVDPTRPGALEDVRAYREAGHEVLLLANAVPVGAGLGDVEIALAGAMAEMPEAVGVLDRLDQSFANDRNALPSLLAPMAEAGMGFVTYGGGFNSGLTQARRDGVPATSVYRVLDAENERATVITRYLDRATFEASQDGRAVVVGRATTDTVTALYSWSVGRRANSVAVAPISAILKDEASGTDG